MRKKVLALVIPLLILLWVLPVRVHGEETIPSGDRVVIWNEGYAMALSADGSGNFRAGVQIALEDGVLTGYTEREIWTVTNLEDGSIRFENGGKFLSLDEVSHQLVLDGPYDSWLLRDLGDNRFRIENRDWKTYLTWYSAREVYAVSDREMDQNILTITRLPEESQETEPPTEIPTEAPTELPTEPPTEPPRETQPPRSLDTGAWNLYVGQLHAHTADSDGAGTVSEAFAYASGVEGLDFFAVTDHSDSFDNDEAGSLTENGAAVSQKWAAGKAAAQAVTDGDFVGIYGFEMSWNQGQGHISTFGTPGFLSRDREGYGDYKDGLEHYYEALLAVPGSVSQFNHPGTQYGDFKNFAFYTRPVDDRITLIEVGSGGGQEYQRSYGYYTHALDQGWHLAPTNNQNNHRGNFGDADTNRTVVLAEDLTEAGIYDALRNYRTYATEDSDLQIYYTLNGAVMGSELSAQAAGETVHLSVRLLDPTDAHWGTVEVITTGGTVAAATDAGEHVTFSLPGSARYYYIRVTQPDGDIAVTAPVWIRQRDDQGIQDLGTEDPLTRAGEEQTIRLKLYNNERQNLTVSTVTLTDQHGEILGTYHQEILLGQYEVQALTLPILLETDGIYTLTAKVSTVFLGENKEFTRNLELSVLPKAITSDVLIDGTHGTYRPYEGLRMLGGAGQIAVHVEKERITPEQLSKCSLLIIPAPGEPFEDEFIKHIKDYVNRGKSLLLLGTAGGSEELNRLLQALGASMAMNSDRAAGPLNNGGGEDPLFASQFHTSLDLLEGQIFAHIGGCTVAPGDGQWLVKSRNGDILLAMEGNVIVAGSDFLEDTWLAKPENSWALPYANRTIAEHLLGMTRTLPEITAIAQIRTGEAGSMYLAEGLVTAGTADPNTAFPDALYFQDATGGMEAVDYGEHRLELGRRVRILGSLEYLDGNPQLRIRDIHIPDKETPLQPKDAANNLDHATQGGQLLRLKGEVTAVNFDGNTITSFVLQDTVGNRATVWIDNPIRSKSLSRVVKQENQVSAVGFPYMLAGKTVLRLRSCDEVVLLYAPPEPTVPPTTEPAETSAPTEAPEETTVGLPSGNRLLLSGAPRPTEPETEPTEFTQPEDPPRITMGFGAQDGKFLWAAGVLLLLAAVAMALKQKIGK